MKSNTRPQSMRVPCRRWIQNGRQIRNWFNRTWIKIVPIAFEVIEMSWLPRYVRKLSKPFTRPTNRDECEQKLIRTGGAPYVCFPSLESIRWIIFFFLTANKLCDQTEVRKPRRFIALWTKVYHIHGCSWRMLLSSGVWRTLICHFGISIPPRACAPSPEYGSNHSSTYQQLLW